MEVLRCPTVQKSYCFGLLKQAAVQRFEPGRFPEELYSTAIPFWFWDVLGRILLFRSGIILIYCRSCKKHAWSDMEMMNTEMIQTVLAIHLTDVVIMTISRSKARLWAISLLKVQSIFGEFPKFIFLIGDLRSVVLLCLRSSCAVRICASEAFKLRWKRVRGCWGLHEMQTLSAEG